MMVRTQVYLPDVVHDRLKARGQILTYLYGAITRKRSPAPRASKRAHNR
jgi:hypothetical protein